jgi:hypothetical protein
MRDVWLGAVVTALLFEVGKFLIGLYIGNRALARRLLSSLFDLGLLLGADRADGRRIYPRPRSSKSAIEFCG